MGQPANGQRTAGIDVGTTSFLLVILEHVDGAERVVVDRADIVRLGEGVDRERKLSPAARQRALDMLGTYAEVCRDHEVGSIRAVGTSALRDAADAQSFVREVRQATGIAIEVISGEQEASLTYRAVAQARETPGAPLVLIDVGGGSTEIVRGSQGRVIKRRSIDMGAIRLTDRVDPGDPPSAVDLRQLREMADEAFAGVADAAAEVVGTGGTITTLAAVELGLHEYDAGAVERCTLTPAQVDALLDRLAAMPLAERRQVPGLPPKRADVILGGAALLASLLRRLRVESVGVSAGGLRYALAREASRR